MKRGETALIRSIRLYRRRVPMQAESAAPRRWRARRQCRRGSFKVSRRLSAVSWRLEGRSAAGHGGSGRSPPGPPKGVFFLQSKKAGHTVKQGLGVNEKFFRRAATPAGVAGEVR